MPDDTMSRRWKKLAVMVLLATWGTMTAAVAMATGEWKVEFERICGQSNMAADLPAEQLERLIKDSDTLLLQLEKIKPEEAKVVIFRLKKSRNFFQYLLQSRAAGAKENQTPN
ncbi:MAG: hypothetical protein COX17_06095 [Deltaproteobacteria bacterium CG23_combo_of_CG06-09_8_20_14_all_60_8]|nr:MAG: hypothetical protein AUK28_09785 [Desulfobacterales bacterium CG2_30_60_27]PIP43598.1 MAG: hypothetical protein COX17_06095 [Deltaproteobacteria bacterium CG23_combo_of_CG06-09_8_20_14_all_60_8]